MTLQKRVDLIKVAMGACKRAGVTTLDLDPNKPLPSAWTDADLVDQFPNAVWKRMKFADGTPFMSGSVRVGDLMIRAMYTEGGG